MAGGSEMGTERQNAADWRIIWQMFFPCAISDLIGGCVEVLGHLDGNMARIVSALLTVAVIYPFYRDRMRKKGKNECAALGEGSEGFIFSQNETSGRENRGYFRRNVSAMWKILLGAAAFSFVLNLISWNLAHRECFSGWLYPGGEPHAVSLFSGPRWEQLFLMGFVSPLSEELLFRGILFERLRLVLPFFWAALGSAAFFGLTHGNWAQGIYAALMGLVLAWLYEKKKCLWKPVLFHGAANLTALLMQMLLFKM